MDAKKREYVDLTSPPLALSRPTPSGTEREEELHPIFTGALLNMPSINDFGPPITQVIGLPFLLTTASMAERLAQHLPGSSRSSLL